MTTLLITNIPPCEEIATGMVLDRICRMFTPGAIACFSVTDPRITPRLSPELGRSIPFRTAIRPREYWRLLPGLAGGLLTLGMEAATAGLLLPGLVRSAASFAAEVKAKRLWCILDGQTTIRIARPLARMTGLPLHTLVWDPPEGILRSKELDRFTSSRLLSEFDRIQSSAVSCTAISGPMAEDYRQRYRMQSVTVYPGQPASIALPPGILHEEGPLRIGMGGQMYCPEAWNSLIATLEQSGWVLAGRPVILRVTGKRINLSATGAMQIEYLGWQDYSTTLRLMNECDLLYCPCWFSPEWKEQIRHSFPSKLPTLLVSGRPVFFHGPEEAAPARFLREHQAGILCHSLEPAVIRSSLESILRDPLLYRSLTENGVNAFLTHLTEDQMRCAIQEALHLESSAFKSPESTPGE